MNLKKQLVLYVVLLLNTALFAQDVVTGVVSDAQGAPIPGANVLVVGTSRGASTDFDGNFSLEVEEGEVLHFSYIGFVTKLVTVGENKTLNVILEEDLSELDEVVVIGYGTQKKSHVTGAVSKVVNDDLDQIAVSRVDDALVGQVSGVNIQSTDGEAGAAPTITIRGVGSMAGDSTPLIVVDGIIVDSSFLGSLNMNDVESFEILKDAASSSIYGSKGSNGIIMISMKSGVAGKTRVNYSTFTGMKTARKSEAYGFTTQGWADMQMEDNGVLSQYTQAQLQIGTDRSWQDVFFEDGTITNHSLSIRGGNDKTKFTMSMNYSEDEGVMLVDNYKKIGARLKVDSKLNDKVSVGANFSPSYTNRRRFSENIHNVARHQPWLPIYHTEQSLQYVDPNGAYADLQVGDYARQDHFTIFDLVGDDGINDILTNIGNSNNANPYARIVERNRTDKKFQLYGSLYAQYEILEGLTFKTSLSGSYNDTRRIDYMGTQARESVTDAYMQEISQKDNYIIFDNFFNYNKSFGKHDLGVTLGNSVESRNYFYSGFKGTGYTNDVVMQITNATAISEFDGFEWQKRGISYVSRLTYAYDNKYLASFSMRRDGSSIFGSDFKYGNFPAASLGWNIAKEDFMSESDVINNLKFRVSYGVTGNDRLNTGATDPDANGSEATLSTGNILVDYYPYLALLGAAGNSYAVDGSITAGFSPVNIANPGLKWERLVEINPGIDFGLLNNRITGSVDWYQRTSDQLLLNNPISVTTGFEGALVNLGEVKNEGWEFELRTKNISSEKFSWSTTVIATTNKNTLVDFADSDGQITSLDPSRPAEWINLEGQPISQFYGYVVDKEIPLEYLDRPYRHVGAQSGLVYVKDLNGDGVLDEEDKTELGNPYPELIWSFTNEFSIGDFDFSFMFQGSHGAEVRNIADHYLFSNNNNRTILEGTPDQEFLVDKYFTNSIVQDASYIALRNVNIGYNFPSETLDKLKLQGLRIYATGQNLIYETADNYTGWNPEALDKTSPTQSGYQRGGSPIYSTISLGLNLDF
ncbi:SusC/RagA family TonB-linked outer membrane protein [Formosa algae]|uniref:TonB-linked SusC/RagA family outer membrane protein n=3 Tax=Formosa algae TaxID=225843 RepID=A0A9X1C8L7_9FLAO|nr:TonB-dependent receptor [Formosa algae]MBP1839461.1 TonB-linked SusC/RagA family outer membrane protein [Formosa algae]MDQ0334765.1 TonB-linked SusC/RagA family outer membrane protein [Formosa algae]OEI82124.1 SusC/RagA family TonB-linked outer membrane protein [Formosa algae]